MTNHYTLKACTLSAILMGYATPALTDACDTGDDLLMYCTFNGGKKEVSLCHSDGLITYTFGALNQPPELTMASYLAYVDYTPFAYASNTVFEMVEMMYLDTRYAIYSSTARGPYNGITDGGITVTLPDQSRVELTCDAGRRCAVFARRRFRTAGRISSIIPLTYR